MCFIFNAVKSSDPKVDTVNNEDTDTHTHTHTYTHTHAHTYTRAHTRIVQHCISSDSESVVDYVRDTNILVIQVDHFAKRPWMEAGTSIKPNHIKSTQLINHVMGTLYLL